MDNIEVGGKRHKRSLMYCSLLASGLFLKVEIKSMTKNVWNQGFAELQTLPVSVARLGGFGHSAWAQGHSGWQPCQPEYARRVGLSGSPVSQNSASENSHRIPEKRSTQEE